MANMAGSWLALAQGFAGMRIVSGKLKFEPYLPHNLQGYSFRIVYKGNRLEIVVSNSHVLYTLHAGKKVVLSSGENASFAIYKP